MVPERISALGIDFSQGDQRAFLHVIAAVVIYLLVAFLLYAASDLVAWRLALHQSIEELRLERARREMGLEENVPPDRFVKSVRIQMRIWHTASRPVAFLRGVFEFAVPVVVAALAVIAIVSAVPTKRAVQKPVAAPSIARPPAG
jgi:hypothetical protein